MLGGRTLAARPLVSGAALPEPYKLAAVMGEFGFAAWSFSRQAKLNAWSWHGLADANVLAWAAIGSHIYIRKDIDSFVHTMQPDVFLAEGETNTESHSVEATTQWLDFGKAGKAKALTGIDGDFKNVELVEVYIAVDGSRDGVLAESVAIGDNQGGWTYSGEVIPLSVTATEFKLRFIGSANEEVQVNRVTLYWDDVSG